MQYSKKTIYTASAVVIALILVTVVYATSGLFVPAFAITSSAFTENSMIPSTYTCDGEGISPPLAFSNVPKNTRSIAVYLFDPDAPKGGFVHWVLYDIDPQTLQVEEGKIPSGSVLGLNGAGKPAYQPICPTSGTHHYTFTAYALSSTYSFVRAPDINHLKKVMTWQVLGRATLTAKYTHQ